MAVRSFDPAQVEKVLREFWKRETSTSLRDPNEAVRGDRDGDIFDLLPEMSSHEAVKVLLDLAPVLGVKLKKSIIRRGGYKNCDDFVEHVMQRIQEELGLSRGKVEAASAVGDQNARHAS
jgi:hypothetical protein